MEKTPAPTRSVDDYIARFPPEVQDKLQRIRAVIREHAPAAQEKISYQMPTYYLHGNLVHFAAYKNHIGFYPTPTGVAEFQTELAEYKSAKGSVQFSLDQEPPYELIARIVRFRVRENMGEVADK